MAHSTHDKPPSDRISGDGHDDKNVPEYLDEVEDVDKRPQGLVMPPLVANMSPEVRIQLEKKLRRKIDLRLLVCSANPQKHADIHSVSPFVAARLCYFVRSSMSLSKGDVTEPLLTFDYF